MRRFAFAIIAGAGFILMGTQVKAEVPVQYLVLNTTFAGDANNPVITDVTFTNLLLSEQFSDGFTVGDVPLYDPFDSTHTATNSLDTTTFNLYSDPFFVSPHGTLQSATLTGTFNTTSFEVTPGGPGNIVTVNPNFTATLTNPATDTFVDILAQDTSSRNTYSAGIFGIYAAPVPEPKSSLVFLIALGTLTGFYFKNRLSSNNSQPEFFTSDDLLDSIKS